MSQELTGSKQIRIKKSTAQKLARRGDASMTMNDVIEDLLKDG